MKAFTTPIQQYQDGNRKAVANGKLMFFKKGTRIENHTRVPLDIDGRPFCDVFLSESSTVELYTSKDERLWTRDIDVMKKEIKTFTATHLNKHAQEVFAAARDDGAVVIDHSSHYGGVFAIVWNPDFSEEEVLQQMRDYEPLTEQGLRELVKRFYGSFEAMANSDPAPDQPKPLAEQSE